MSEPMYTRKQVESVIKKTTIMVKDFLADKDMSGTELYEAHKDHINSFIIPEAVTLAEAVEAHLGGIVSHYPDWQEEEPEHPWHDKVAERFCKSLSDTQKIILRTIVDNNNQVTGADLKKAIIASGIKWTNNLTLGGSLGGLSRKCVYRYEIPYVYGWNEEDGTYFIVPEALPFMKKYLP